MAASQLVERAPHPIRVVRAAQPDHVHDVVSGTARGQLVQEPQLLLGERERAGSVLGAPRDPRRIAHPRPLGVGQDGRQVPDGRVLEQGPRVDVHAEEVADA